jgi:hypothetical protein
VARIEREPAAVQNTSNHALKSIGAGSGACRSATDNRTRREAGCPAPPGPTSPHAGIRDRGRSATGRAGTSPRRDSGRSSGTTRPSANGHWYRLRAVPLRSRRDGRIGEAAIAHLSQTSTATRSP